MTKEEIFRIIIEESSREDEFKKFDKFKLLLSLSNEDILDFVKENGDWMKKNEMNVSDITVRMNPNYTSVN